MAIFQKKCAELVFGWNLIFRDRKWVLVKLNWEYVRVVCFDLLFFVGTLNEI